jgi:hypothetical protein
LGESAPDTAPADLQALLRQQRLNATGAVGATPLRNIALYFVLHLLIGVSLSARQASTPLVVAAARDLEDPT